MKRLLVSFAILGVSGCAACQQQAAPAGIPLAGTMPSANMGASGCEAIPTIGIGWEKICISIPKPKLYAVAKPAAAAQMYAIPMIPAAAMPMAVPGQMMAQQAPVMAQPQLPQANSPEPPRANAPEGCGDSCTGCSDSNVGRNELEQLVQDLTDEVATMQEQVSSKSAN